MFAIAPRRLLVLGLLLGAAALAIGAWVFLKSPTSKHSFGQRRWTLIGAILITLGFAFQLVGQLSR